ncbi:MAG: hypothetical protein OXD30_05480 [Bryobacterales bacterium]|nr:hypothetical protein [Bryobacterales bacterium]
MKEEALPLLIGVWIGVMSYHCVFTLAIKKRLECRLFRLFAACARRGVFKDFGIFYDRSKDQHPMDLEEEEEQLR